MVQTQITCRGFDLTESISSAVQHHVEKLEKVYDRISRCEVVVELSHRHHHQGQVFHVQVHVHLPKGTIVVNREPELNHAHEDFPVALRDAFRAARRKLEDDVRIQRGFVKRHQFRGQENNPPLASDAG